MGIHSFKFALNLQFLAVTSCSGSMIFVSNAFFKMVKFGIIYKYPDLEWPLFLNYECLTTKFLCQEDTFPPISCP